MNRLEYLVIHCTATPEGRHVSADDIRAWHLSKPPIGRGWKQVGYSEVIHLDGQVEQFVDNNDDDTVDSLEITNGVAGINYKSRHIAYVGGLDAISNKPKDTRTQQQKQALNHYVLEFVRRYSQVKVAGHNQFASKACPCFEVQKWCRQIGIPEKNIYKPITHSS